MTNKPRYRYDWEWGRWILVKTMICAASLREDQLYSPEDVRRVIDEELKGRLK